MYPVTVFYTFMAVVSVLVGPRCPGLLNCIDVHVHTVAHTHTTPV